MQSRFCTFIFFLCCTTIWASCSDPSSSNISESEPTPDSLVQQELRGRLNSKLDSLEVIIAQLAEEKESQQAKRDSAAEIDNFRQDVANKLGEAENKLAELTQSDSTTSELEEKHTLWAWIQAPFNRKSKVQDTPKEEESKLTEILIEDDAERERVQTRLDSLLLQVDALTETSSSLQQDTTPEPPSLLQQGSDFITSARADSVSSNTPENASIPSDAQSSAEEEAQRRLNAEQLRQYWGRILQSAVIFILFWFLIRGITWTLDKLAERSATRRLLFKRITPISKILLWVFAIYIVVVYVFSITGAQLVATGAAAGVALAFAAQDVLKNIFGGLIIIADQPFQVGDKISVGATYGEVVSIGLRSTRIVTSDDNLVSVPNSQVVESQVANANAGELYCQVVVELYLPGWVDVTKAKSIAYSAAATSKYVYLDKPIVVIVLDDFKEMSLIRLSIKAYVFDCLNELAFKSEVTETAKMEFLRHDMLSPFAHNFRPYLKNNREGMEDGEAMNP